MRTNDRSASVPNSTLKVPSSRLSGGLTSLLGDVEVVPDEVIFSSGSLTWSVFVFDLSRLSGGADLSLNAVRPVQVCEGSRSEVGFSFVLQLSSISYYQTNKFLIVNWQVLSVYWNEQ